MTILFSVCLGFLLDCLIGDPTWLPHPVVWMGKGIHLLEQTLRNRFPKKPHGELHAGKWLAIIMAMLSLLFSSSILYLAYHISFWLWFALHTFWAGQLLAGRCMKQESRKVAAKLQKHDILGARKQLSYLVGRDTSELTEAEIIKACVETTAENTSDGVTAPLFWMMLGGVPFGMLYKAINTMDSMIGYRNQTYLYFGRTAALLDDIANWIPARITGLLMIISAPFLKLSGNDAWRVFKRDRLAHLSPNSAQTESAIAGALGIQLGGTHVYFGEVVKKPTIGDAMRQPKQTDIEVANRMLTVTSVLALILFGLVRFGYVALLWCI